jgi:cytochrome c-type biogenesis protein CcsB
VTVDQNLAQLSNTLIYSAMAVYAIAFVLYTIDLSGRGRSRTGAAAVQKEPALAGASATASSAASSAASGAAVIDLRGAPPVSAGGSVDAAHAGDGEPGPERRKAAAVAVSLTWLGLALHLGSVIARGLAAHRVPWGNMYEFSITGTLVVVAVFVIVLLSQDFRFLGTFVLGPVVLSLGLAVTVFYTQAAQLVPALQSFWLVIHVSVAFIASALLTLGFSLTVIQLVQQRREDARAQDLPLRRGAFMDRLPSSAELEYGAYRLHAIAFPLWTFTLMAGAIWAESAWGRYWNWDPKEVWTFIIWVVYAGYLHARATRGWDGRRAAYLALAGFACVLINYCVVNIFFSGLHSYADVGPK